jgi:carbonic anhydrase
MQKLIEGIHEFQNQVFDTKRELFRNLANGQRPGAIFITCSDSRVNPNLLTQTEPGEIFVLRNAGNLIPPAPCEGGEIATIEFALVELNVRDIIVCGHSDCGAMKGVLNPAGIEERMPAVHRWLRHGRRTKEIIEREYCHLAGRELLTATVEENVLVQIENLRTHKVIESRGQSGEVVIHGWVYKFETGQVYNYDPAEGQFLPIGLKNNVISTYPRNCAPKTEAARRA